MTKSQCINRKPFLWSSNFLALMLLGVLNSTWAAGEEDEEDEEVWLVLRGDDEYILGKELQELFLLC